LSAVKLTILQGFRIMLAGTDDFSDYLG